MEIFHFINNFGPKSISHIWVLLLKDKRVTVFLHHINDNPKQKLPRLSYIFNIIRENSQTN